MAISYSCHVELASILEAIVNSSRVESRLGIRSTSRDSEGDSLFEGDRVQREPVFLSQVKSCPTVWHS